MNHSSFISRFRFYVLNKKIDYERKIEISSFYATKRVAKSLSYYHELNEKQRSYVPDFEDNCKEALKCIDHNNKVINLIIEDSFLMFENKSDMVFEISAILA